MTGCSSLHYWYNVSYQCWFSSEEAKIYYNNFNSLNAVLCSHLILAYTVWLAIINAAELEQNGLVFFYLYWGMLCWDWKEHRQKLAKRISYQIWYERCLKGKFGRGVQICEGGGPYPQCHRDDVSSFLKYYQLSSEILDYKLILFRSGHFDHDMEKNITVIGMF